MATASALCSAQEIGGRRPGAGDMAFTPPTNESYRVAASTLSAGTVPLPSGHPPAPAPAPTPPTGTVPPFPATVAVCGPRTAPSQGYADWGASLCAISRARSAASCGQMNSTARHGLGNSTGSSACVLDTLESATAAEAIVSPQSRNLGWPWVPTQSAPGGRGGHLRR